ncbi:MULTISPECIES: hypothetical protein [unclassified Variovorax]|uniref:hypothetical protein n=1 Tax=unclassified Variovorax TaxID=663243 RepID=UPI003ECE987D
MATQTVDRRGALASGVRTHEEIVGSSKGDNPCNHAQVRELIKNVRSGNAKRSVKPHKQAALTKAPMEAILATCDDSPRGKRDRALLLFA